MPVGGNNRFAKSFLNGHFWSHAVAHCCTLQDGPASCGEICQQVDGAASVAQAVDGTQILGQAPLACTRHSQADCDGGRKPLAVVGFMRNRLSRLCTQAVLGTQVEDTATGNAQQELPPKVTVTFEQVIGMCMRGGSEALGVYVQCFCIGI